MLREARARDSEIKRGRVLKTLEEMTAAGEKITFRWLASRPIAHVAAEAGVSRRYLTKCDAVAFRRLLTGSSVPAATAARRALVPLLQEIDFVGRAERGQRIHDHRVEAPCIDAGGRRALRVTDRAA